MADRPPSERPDPRNQLNELSGRESVYALRSVISTHYPTCGPEAYAHDLRLACSLEGRSAIGIDLSPRYAEIYAAVCERLALAPQPYLVADARDLASLPT